jgi:uncharacterized protein YndB with AHSA1/START domain
MANKLIIVRVFDAPVNEVWKYWTEPELLKRWWGPKIFTCPVVKMDFRVGGKYLSCMRGSPAPGAPVQDFWSTGTYKGIIPMKKIVVTDSFADEEGNIVPSSHYGMEGFPLEMLVTFEFEEADGKTKMTLTHSGLENIDEKMREGMAQGWNESFDKLVEIVK